MKDKTLLDFRGSDGDGLEFVEDGRTHELLIKVWYDTGCVYYHLDLDEFIEFSNGVKEYINKTE